MRDFNKWINEFRVSISNFGYFVNFCKVYKNVENIKIELNALTSLIKSKSIEEDFRLLFKKLPSIASCIPILLAIRDISFPVLKNKITYTFDFDKSDIDECVFFMNESGLFDLISNHLTSSIYDYTIGVEVGLDSNGRKNRGGVLMEALVEEHIKMAGFVENESYFKEMKLEDIQKRWSIDLNLLPVSKRFDFVVKTKDIVYGIETNFYSGNKGGSKLNETARSYKLIAEKSINIEGFKFVWITDGTAWKHAKNDLKETFNILEDIYNLAELERRVLTQIVT